MPKKWISDEEETKAILRECTEGSLATVCPDGSPYVVTVNYLYHKDCIYLHGSLTGKKMENIAHDERVCFEVHVVEKIVRAADAINFGTRYRSVIINGRAKVLDDPRDKRNALMLLTAKYAGGASFNPPTDRQIETTAVIQIKIDNMTGKESVDP